jgi:hypothetical protein
MPYEAFSTLHPENIFPFDNKMAAPTRKFEYGACACFMTLPAARSSFSCAFLGSGLFGMIGSKLAGVLLNRAQL